MRSSSPHDFRADASAVLVAAGLAVDQTILRELRRNTSTRTFRLEYLVRQLEAWGYEVNLYAVPDHESFLQAVLLVPRSVTADFKFPEWNYYGRGSGERRLYHRYPTRRPTAVA